MRALILTNEYPPEIYGGAGVHVDELTRHLRELVELDIRTFGSRAEAVDGWRVQGYPQATTWPVPTSRCDRCCRPCRGTSRWSPIR